MRVHPRDQLLHLGHHLDPDAVAGEQEELLGRHIVASTCPVLIAADC
jgi:hypothetical protein